MLYRPINLLINAAETGQQYCRELCVVDEQGVEKIIVPDLKIFSKY
jgi:hypothetical protein